MTNTKKRLKKAKRSKKYYCKQTHDFAFWKSARDTTDQGINWNLNWPCRTNMLPHLVFLHIFFFARCIIFLCSPHNFFACSIIFFLARWIIFFLARCIFFLCSLQIFFLHSQHIFFICLLYNLFLYSMHIFSLRSA